MASHSIKSDSLSVAPVASTNIIVPAEASQKKHLLDENTSKIHVGRPIWFSDCWICFLKLLHPSFTDAKTILIIVVQSSLDLLDMSEFCESKHGLNAFAWHPARIAKTTYLIAFIGNPEMEEFCTLSDELKIAYRYGTSSRSCSEIAIIHSCSMMKSARRMIEIQFFESFCTCMKITLHPPLLYHLHSFHVSILVTSGCTLKLINDPL